MPVTASELKELVTSIVTVVGGSGGLLYLVERLVRVVDWFRNQPRLGVRILQETQDDKGLPWVNFEATNLGIAPVALEPTINVVGLWLLGGDLTPWRGELTFFGDIARDLDPHKPKRLTAAGTESGQHAFAFLWYRVYTFRATRGRPCRVYLRHIAGPQLSWLRFQWERIQLLLPWTRDALLKRVGLRLPDTD